MTTERSDVVGWLHGLQDYLEFKQDTNTKQFIDFLLKLQYAEDTVITINPDSKIKTLTSTIRKFSPNEILDCIHKIYDRDLEELGIVDAFSRGQIKSKIWMAEELDKLALTNAHVLVIGSWLGLASRFIDRAQWAKIRMLDQDPRCMDISDKIFNLEYLENHLVKGVVGDVDQVHIDTKGYVLPMTGYEERFNPDLVINTSSEHMSTNWFQQLKYKKLRPIVVIQSNNLFDIPEHVNAVYSIEHMKKIFNMSKILYEGELQLSGYKRFMLIGRP